MIRRGRINQIRDQGAERTADPRRSAARMGMSERLLWSQMQIANIVTDTGARAQSELSIAVPGQNDRGPHNPTTIPVGASRNTTRHAA